MLRLEAVAESLVTAICLLVPLQASAQALHPTVALSTNSLISKAEIRGGETVGLEQVKRAFISLGTNQVAFRLPPELRLDASKQDKVVLWRPDKSWFITLRWIKPEDDAPILGINDCRDIASHRFSNSTITREFCEFALNRSGPAFELGWSIAGSPQCANVVYIPLSRGVLELILVASAEQLATARTDLVILLTSLQTDENGPIKFEVLPDFS